MKVVSKGMNMNRGTVIVNTLTGERKLLFEHDEIKEYLETTKPNFELCIFDNMTDDEKMSVLEYNYNLMKEFDNSIKGTGRSADNSIRIDFSTFSWIIEELKKRNK